MIGLRIFAYRDIKKWQTEIVMFHCKFDIVMNAVNYIESFKVLRFVATKAMQQSS